MSRLEFLLYSSFAVVVAYVHQLTIFMIVPIFNSMARIDKRVVEAAIDAGASRFDIMRLIIVPLSKSGIALGSIFVASIVMGDFFVTKVMSGGGSASVVGAFYEDISVLQYPGAAAASAIVLTVVLLVTVSLILRTSISAKKSPNEHGAAEYPGAATRGRANGRHRAEPRRPSLDVLCAGDAVHASMWSHSTAR